MKSTMRFDASILNLSVATACRSFLSKDTKPERKAKLHTALVVAQSRLRYLHHEVTATLRFWRKDYFSETKQEREARAIDREWFAGMLEVIDADIRLIEKTLEVPSTSLGIAFRRAG